MSHKSDLTVNWWEIIKSNPRNTQDCFRGIIMRISVGELIEAAWSCAGLMLAYGFMKVIHNSYGCCAPWGYDRVLQTQTSEGFGLNRIAALELQFNFCTFISEPYLDRCILHAQIPRSPARQDFSVSSTFAAPCPSDGSIQRWTDICW